MKPQLPRLELIQEYDHAPEWTLFNQQTVAAIRNCSLATVERDRWIGAGIPFIKMGRLVRYRKADIQNWLDQQTSFQSTTGVTQSQAMENENEIK